MCPAPEKLRKVMEEVRIKTELTCFGPVYLKGENNRQAYHPCRKEKWRVNQCRDNYCIKEQTKLFAMDGLE